MVLRLKAWESRSLPGLASTGGRQGAGRFRRLSAAGKSRPGEAVRHTGRSRPGYLISMREPDFTRKPDRLFCDNRRKPGQDAGWSSLVARQAHNLKVVGSNPTPATTQPPENIDVFRGFLCAGSPNVGKVSTRAAAHGIYLQSTNDRAWLRQAALRKRSRHGSKRRTVLSYRCFFTCVTGIGNAGSRRSPGSLSRRNGQHR